MPTIGEVLATVPFFAELEALQLEMVGGCARLVRITADGYLFRTGAAADSLYVVRNGQVAIEAAEPGAAGAVRVVETVGDGGVVGWSWLVPPYRWLFDARALLPTAVVHVDAACLRHACEVEPRLGYRLLQLVTRAMHERLYQALTTG